ncbi:MAG: porphobilinogen synthase [Myxococcota bacterium]
MNCAIYPAVRPRRLRQKVGFRRLFCETHLGVDDLICPLFVHEGLSQSQPIASMPGQQQHALGDLPKQLDGIASLGIPAILLFGIPQSTDENGSIALRQEGIVPRTLRLIKQRHPQLVIMTDLCLCSFLCHGHCGLVTPSGQVDNDSTLQLLGKMALLYAQAGADVVAPSGMIDGMVQTIRHSLDKAKQQHVAILSYAAKQASHFYGPFRHAACSSPQFGDRRSYQMDPANAREAMREMQQDRAEGADALMIKPALPCLDIAHWARQQLNIPLVAYQVSGEYAMLHAAAQKGWLSLQHCALESLLAIKRAGADAIVTYFAQDCVRWLQKQKEGEYSNDKTS